MKATPIHRIAVAILLGMLAVGCDSSQSDVIVLPNFVIQDLFFDFTGKALVEGEPQDVPATAAVNIAGLLQQKGGFIKSDIVSARLESVQLEVVFPVAATIDFIDEAVLFVGTGSDSREIARQTTFPPTSDIVTMNRVGESDLTALMSGAPFDAMLSINPSQLDPNADYKLAAILTLTVEVN